MDKLTGKVALVTGAGQGVGQGIALALAITCDVFKAEDITRTVQRTVESLGGIDILVNNAYDGAFGPLLSLDDEAFMRGIHAGPLASFRFMRACHPHLKARGGGNIVNLVTSASVRWDSSNYGAYAVAKQGIRALTRAAAHEWGR